MARAGTPSKAPFRDVSPSSAFAGEISWMKDTKTTTGWPDGTFRPWNKINRDAMAAFLYRMAGSPAYTPPKYPLFKDLKKSNAFYKEISWMGETGISTGWDDRTYRPYQPVERGAMAAFLYRFCSKHADKCSPAVATNNYVQPMKDIFRDVRYKRRGNLSVAAFHKEIGWLADSGITTGWPDGTFRPVNYIDRNAMAAFIYRIKSNKR